MSICLFSITLSLRLRKPLIIEFSGISRMHPTMAIQDNTNFVRIIVIIHATCVKGWFE